MAPRIPLPSDLSGPLGIPDTSGLCPEQDLARQRVSNAIGRLRGVAPVTQELVRLRNAAHQGCRLCQSLRSAAAFAAGATEELLQARDDRDSPLLSDEHRAALELADLFLDDPTGIDEARAERITSALTSEQIVELIVRLIGWTANKPMIALGLDRSEITPGELY